MEREPGTRVLQGEKTTAVVIFLHGLGDTSEGWSFEMMDIQDKYPYIKFILPTAYVSISSLLSLFSCLLSFLFFIFMFFYVCAYFYLFFLFLFVFIC